MSKFIVVVFFSFPLCVRWFGKLRASESKLRDSMLSEQIATNLLWMINDYSHKPHLAGACTVWDCGPHRSSPHVCPEVLGSRYSIIYGPRRSDQARRRQKNDDDMYFRLVSELKPEGAISQFGSG